MSIFAPLLNTSRLFTLPSLDPLPQVSILNLQGELANSTMQDISLDVLQTIVKYSSAPLSDQLIQNAFPAAVQCILRTDDHSIMQSGGECLRAFIFVAPEQVCSFRNGEGLNYIMQVITMLLNPMNTEFSAVFVGRLVITVISKAASMLGENVYLILKAVISKMQLVESLSVAMSLILTFAHLFILQMDALLNFLSTVPGPTGTYESVSLSLSPSTNSLIPNRRASHSVRFLAVAESTANVLRCVRTQSQYDGVVQATGARRHHKGCAIDVGDDSRQNRSECKRSNAIGTIRRGVEGCADSGENIQVAHQRIGIPERIECGGHRQRFGE